jgi:RNA polymerase sigma-70 factor (ECF subfamily)
MENYRTFYMKHKDKLFAYLMRMTGDYYLSSDVMQESFARYFEHYREKTRSVTLLYAIARHALTDIFRKMRNHSQIDDGHQDDSNDPEHDILVRDEYKRVLNAMQQLNTTEREILALAVSSDLTYGDIASVTGLSESNIKVKVHRARIKLRNILYSGDRQ